MGYFESFYSDPSSSYFSYLSFLSSAGFFFMRVRAIFVARDRPTFVSAHASYFLGSFFFVGPFFELPLLLPSLVLCRRAFFHPRVHLQDIACFHHGALGVAPLVDVLLGDGDFVLLGYL